MCSRLFFVQLQFWSAWNGIINLAGRHVWVLVGQKEVEIVGGGWWEWGCGLANFWRCFKQRDRELADRDFAEVEFWIGNVQTDKIRNLTNMTSHLMQIIEMKVKCAKILSNSGPTHQLDSKCSKTCLKQELKHKNYADFQWDFKFQTQYMTKYYDLNQKLWTKPF